MKGSSTARTPEDEPANSLAPSHPICLSSSSADTGVGTCLPVDSSQAAGGGGPFVTPTPMRSSSALNVVPEWLVVYFRAPEKFDHYLDWDHFDLASLLAYDAMLAKVLEAEQAEVNALYERYQSGLYRQYYTRAQGGGSNRSVILTSQSDLNSGTSLSTSVDGRSNNAGQLGGVLSISDTQVNRAISPTNPQKSAATVVRHSSSGMADYRMSYGGASSSLASNFQNRLSVGPIPNPSHYNQDNRRPRSSLFFAPVSTETHRRGYENIAQIIQQERLRLQSLPHNQTSSKAQQNQAVGSSESMPPPPPPLPSRHRMSTQSSDEMASLDELASSLPAGNFFSPQPQQVVRLKRESAGLPPSRQVTRSTRDTSDG